MLNFLSGVLFLYLLAIPLMRYISTPNDPEDHGAPMRFALLWPLAALEVIYFSLIGHDEDE